MAEEVLSSESYVVISLNSYLTRAEEIDVPQNKYMNWEMSEIHLPRAQIIRKNAFFGCSSITEIFLPIASQIEEGAFMGCVSATKIDIPEAIDIGANAFSSCSAATEINMKKAITIGYNAFQECSSVSVIELPVATTIDENAFRGCHGTKTEKDDNGNDVEVDTGLKRIYAPKVDVIGSSAFWGCKLLKEAIFPMAYDVGDKVFTDCKSIEFIDLPLAERMKVGFFGEYSAREKSNTLCSNLKFLNIRTIKSGSFWDDMFYGMDKIQCINMSSVDYGYINQHRPDLGLRPQCDVICQNGIIETLTTTVNEHLEDGDPRRLEVAEVSEEDQSTIDVPENRQVFFIDGLEMDENPDDPIDIYDVAVGCVKDFAFQDKLNVRTIYFPSARQIGMNAFRSCDDLEAVRLPTLSDPSLIGAFAFSDCDKLKYIDLGSIKKDDIRAVEWGIPNGCSVTCSDGTMIVTENE